MILSTDAEKSIWQNSALIIFEHSRKIGIEIKFSNLIKITYNKSTANFMCVLFHFLLCNPMDCNSPGSSAHGILQARILDWVAILPPGDLLGPVVESAFPMAPALVGGFFTTETPGKPTTNIVLCNIRAEIKQTCPLSSCLYNIMLEVLASSIRQERDVKSKAIGKGNHYCLCLKMC